MEESNGSLSGMMRTIAIALALVMLVLGYLLGNSFATFRNGGPANLIDWQLDNYVRGLADSYSRTQDPQYLLRAVCVGQVSPDAEFQRISDRATAADIASDPLTASAYATLLNVITANGGCAQYREINAGQIQQVTQPGGWLVNLLSFVLLAAIVGGGLYLLWQRFGSGTEVTESADGAYDAPARPRPQATDVAPIEVAPAPPPPVESVRESRRREVTPAPPPPPPIEERSVPAPQDSAPQHLAGFTMTYTRGDEGFDKSFIIETSSGDFLGECGVTISESIDRDDLARNATAFELWLFDKNDSRTVTKVIMSDHAFDDDAMRAKLAPRGEPVRATIGEVLVLETASLIINTEITTMQYADEDPLDGIFEQLTLELAAWVKSEHEQRYGSDALSI